MKRVGRRPKRKPGLPRCVLDSGGLTALVGGSQRARAWLRWIVENAGMIRVPTPVLVESTTGTRRDAEVDRILGVLERAAAVLEAPDEITARRAGRLRHAAKSDDGIDALVAASALGDGSPAVLLTSDPDDLARLLIAVRTVHIRAV
jgi:predicted nucleic acid-binding protein